MKAIVRIRIPLKRPVKEAPPSQDQIDQESLASERQKTIEQKEQATDRTENYEEMEVEDKVLLVNPIGETHRVLVFHQAAQRLTRKDILQHMKKNIKELSAVDLEDMVEEVETRAVRAEELMQQLILPKMQG